MESLSARVNDLSQKALMILIAFSVLWKGGKGLEATWMFALVAAAVIVALWIAAVREGSKEKQTDLPRALWLLLLLYLAWTVVSFIFSKTANYGFDEVLREAAQILVFLWV